MGCALRICRFITDWDDNMPTRAEFRICSEQVHYYVFLAGSESDKRACATSGQFASSLAASLPMTLVGPFKQPLHQVGKVPKVFSSRGGLQLFGTLYLPSRSFLRKWSNNGRGLGHEFRSSLILAAFVRIDPRFPLRLGQRCTGSMNNVFTSYLFFAMLIQLTQLSTWSCA